MFEFEEETPMKDHTTRSYAMVSTYPPTQCGIATFAAALSGGLYEYGDDVGIVRVGGTVRRRRRSWSPS